VYRTAAYHHALLLVRCIRTRRATHAVEYHDMIGCQESIISDIERLAYDVDKKHWSGPEPPSFRVSFYGDTAASI